METRHGAGRGTIEMPAPTAAPMVTAFGLALVAAGLVTSGVVSIAGAVVFTAGATGWFRQVLPRDHEAAIPLGAPAPEIPVSTRPVAHRAEGAPRHRARLPVEIYPYSAGIKGGIAGGAAMAVLGVLYGVLEHGSLWYAVNLLAAGASASLTNAGPEQLTAFSATGFVLATIIHAVLSVLVGLLYGVLLPMLPRHPAFWGGIVAPILWTALLAASLDVLNPALDAAIEWRWFIASQVAFGVVAGLVVVRSERVPTDQHDALVPDNQGAQDR